MSQGSAMSTARLAERGRLAAGLVDAGLSALATFAAGIFATRLLDPVTLGGYAMAYAIFVVAGWIPAGLVCTPAEVLASTAPMDRRVAILRSSLRYGVPIAIAGAVVTAPWILVAPGGIQPRDLAALAVTVAGACCVSPLQDHLRRVLHLAALPRVAVTMAVTQLAVVVVTLVAWSASGASPAGAPFGSLVLANLASLVLGLILVRKPLRVEPHERLSWRRIRRSGGPLLAAGMIPSVVTFVTSFLVSRLAGAATLGFVEAARVLSQPVTVVGVGLGAVLGPRITQAAAGRDRSGVLDLLRRYDVLLVATGSLYLLLVGLPFSFDPAATFVPTAYAVPGLMAVSIVSWTLINLSQASRSEQLGAGRERMVARVEVEANIVRLAATLGAPLLGSFIVPLGQSLMAVVRLVRYRVGLIAYYEPVLSLDAPLPDG